MQPLIVTHGGAGSPIKYKDGTEKAAKKGYIVLRKKGNAVDAIIEAVVVLENDPRFNAGTGSKMRLDGSIEMDAAVITSDLKCGAVAAIKNVKNPVKIARKVMKTPHVLLAGEEATNFARKMGFRYYDPTTEKAIKKLEETKRKLREGVFPVWAKKWKKFEYKKFTGTVGAVARDKKRFAAAVSTGGTSLMLPGRVGDSALIGCGIYASRHGAVCATGVGEEIIRNVLAKSVYDRIEEIGSQKACEWGVALLKGFPTGLIAVSKDDYGMSCSENMACTVASKNLIKSGCI
ncbi:MAG: isoaspartyl peptidase/L-asparaginase [Thermoplasmatales archaeon]|nr:isoaspartyl peptidase/L-asparaginase [Thermoplasmatales archaeon]